MFQTPNQGEGRVVGWGRLQICVLEGDLWTEAELARWGPRAEPADTTAVCGAAILEWAMMGSAASGTPEEFWHFTGLTPTSMIGHLQLIGEEGFTNHINWSLRFLRDQFLDPSFSLYKTYHWNPSYKHMVFPTIAMLVTRTVDLPLI